ncbi:CrcB family protein [Halopenitus sp. H-Gu1]|uniref:CrcB family protein n=1 Tax=Halopenitus sp. H-Gu1 TaxID=3242697 RepID=UPI00359D5977
MSAQHTLVRLEALALIGIGGFAGSNLRYFVGFLAPGIPGTLLVNVIGSFVLGFLLYEAIYSGLLAEQTQIVAGTGFLSSFTTYSTFALESLQASPLLLVGNILATYAFGFTGILAGRTLARIVDGGET